MEKEFEFIDHTADIGVKAYGADMKQLFANAGRGLFSIITELEGVGVKESRDILVTAPDRESLLVNWLNELIYLFEANDILFIRFDIISVSATQIHAIGYGEKIDMAKHGLKTQVKAATYHMLKIEENKDSWQAQVIFDV